jgi:hypothetical protein
MARLTYAGFLIAGFALLLSPVAAEASPITFNVIFGPPTGVSPNFSPPEFTGTVTYSQVGDLVPMSISITDTDGGSFTTLTANCVLPTCGWGTVWSGGVPSSLAGNGTSDVVLSASTGALLDLNGAAIYGWSDLNICVPPNPNIPSPGYCGVSSSGSYSMTPVPEPTAILSVALGVLGLGLRRRLGAVR